MSPVAVVAVDTPDPDTEGASELSRLKGAGFEPLEGLNGGLEGEIMGGVQKLKTDEPLSPVGVVGRPGETVCVCVCVESCHAVNDSNAS